MLTYDDFGCSHRVKNELDYIKLEYDLRLLTMTYNNSLWYISEQGITHRIDFLYHFSVQNANGATKLKYVALCHKTLVKSARQIWFYCKF